MNAYAPLSTTYLRATLPQHRQNATSQFYSTIVLSCRAEHPHNSPYRNPVSSASDAEHILQGNWLLASAFEAQGSKQQDQLANKVTILHSGWIQRADAQPRRVPVMAAHNKQTEIKVNKCVIMNSRVPSQSV